MGKLNYEKVYNTLVEKTKLYCESNGIKFLVLGISGNINSAVVAAISRNVCDSLGIKLIGRSLFINEKPHEINTSIKIGEAFCDDFKSNFMEWAYTGMLNSIVEIETNNIQHTVDRYDFEKYINMIPNQKDGIDKTIQNNLKIAYLNSIIPENSFLLSTYDQTDYQLGINILKGNFNPIKSLWKTEVCGLANWLLEEYDDMIENCDKQGLWEDKEFYCNCYTALKATIPKDIPEYIDVILQTLIKPRNHNEDIQWLYNLYPKEIIEKIWDMHLKSEYQRCSTVIDRKFLE